MSTLRISLIFCFLSTFSNAQEWKSWLANYDKNGNNNFQAQAVNSKGELTMVMQTDSIIHSKSMELPTAVNFRSLVTLTAAGKVKKVNSLNGMSIESLQYNNNDELFAIVNTSIVAQGNSKSNYWLLKFNSDLVVTDSIHLLENYPFQSAISLVGKFDLSMNGDDIAFVSKVNGKFSIDNVEHFEQEAYFHGLVRNKPNSLALIYKKFNSRQTSLATIDKPEIAFVAGDIAMLRTGNSTGKKLYRYSQGTAIDSMEIPPNYRGVSMANVDQNGYLYLHLNISGKYTWKDQNISPSGLKTVILKLNDAFDVLDFYVGPQQPLMTGTPGPTYNRYLHGYNGNLYFSIGDEIAKDFGWIRIDANLNTIDSFTFSANLENQSDPAFNPFYAYLLPYKLGLYLVFPQATWPDLALAQLNFPGANDLDALILPVQNLIVHAGFTGVELTKEDYCDSSKFEIAGTIDDVKSVRWLVDGNVDSNSFLTKLVKHKGFTNSKVCAEITMNNGSKETICDSTDNFKDVIVGMKLDTQIVCQWNAAQFETRSEFKSLRLSTYPKFVWELWKKDTVFISSTEGSPKLTFSTPGTYTVKYYFDNGFCKNGITQKDAITVLPATKANISGLPFPVCKGSSVTLKAKEYTGVENQFTWSNGVSAKDSITQIAGSANYQWAILNSTSPNGCITSDSSYFRVRQSANYILDSLITSQNLKPVFYFDTSAGFKKVILNRNQPTNSDTFWMKKTHGDLSIDLNTGLPVYTLNGIDSCGNTLLNENWTPILLAFNEGKNSLEVDSQGFGSAQHLMRKKGGKWIQLNIPLWELALDTFTTGEYEFQYRENDLKTDRAIISNVLEINFTKEFLLPNAFSPNGDNINDIFWAYTPKGFEILEVRIYARTGQLAARSETLAEIWDGQIMGQDAPVGKYTYIIKYVNGEEKYHNGTVMLLR